MAASSLNSGIQLHLFARGAAVSILFLLLAGGMVTSTGSGLAVPDWPLSFGQFFPPMRGGVFFEHGHRMIAGVVGLFIFFLASWVQWKESRIWVRFLAWMAVGAVGLQAILGGITVLYKLPPLISILHACLGQAIFCLILALAEVLSPRWERSDANVQQMGFLSQIGAVTFLLGYAQLVLGAILRHTGSGLWLHVIGAILFSLSVVVFASRVATETSESVILRPMIVMIAAFTLQILLGAGTAALKILPTRGTWDVSLATAHTACGALVLGTCLVLTLRAYRRG